MKESSKNTIESKTHASSANEEEKRKAENLHDNFDPYDYGPEDGIKSCGTAILLTRGSIGASFLLLPFVMKSLGYITGSLLVLVASIGYYHSLHALVSTEYKVCKQLKLQRLSNIELTSIIFQRCPFPINKIGIFIECLMYTFYGISSSGAASLVLMAHQIQTIAKYFDVHMQTTHIITIEIIPLVIVCMSPKLIEILVPFSSVTNMFSLIMAAIIVVYSTVNRQEFATCKPFGDITFIPEGTAKVVKAVCCTSLILPFKDKMRRPQQLSKPFGPLNVAAFTVTLFYYSFGAITYLNYGEDIRENILNNLPEKNFTSDCINFFYIPVMMVVYVMSFFGRFNNVWTGKLKQIFVNKNCESLGENCVRIGVNLIAYLLAIGVSDFALVTATAGAGSILFDMTLPSVLELLYEIEQPVKRYFVIFKDFLLISVCMMLFFMSSKACIKQIMKLHAL